jgi:hypothetical protein
MCEAAGRAEAATVADHVQRHGGDWELFYFGQLESLCLNCHNIHKQRIETRGFSSEIGTDGFAVDPRHPHHTGHKRR